VGYRLYRGHSEAKQGLGSAGSDPDFEFLNPDDLENSDYTFPNHNEAVFIEHIFNLSPRWSVTPGLRYENINTRADGYYKQFVYDAAGNVVVENTLYEDLSRQRDFLIGGLGVTFKPNAATELYGNLSQNYRAINFTDLRITNPNLVVDPNIRDERGFTADLGIRGGKEGLVHYEVTAFYIAYKDRIGQVLRADQPPLYNDYRWRGNIADARNIGVEAFAETDVLALFKRPHPKLRWTVFVNGAYVDARYINSEDNAVDGNYVEMAPPVMVRTGTGLNMGPWRASFQVAYTSKHYSDATNAERTATAVEGAIPAYTVADLSASYTWKWLTLEASCNNLFNAYYFTRRADSYPGPGIIPSDGRGLYVTVMGTF
jgi:Fe(3+) dicitrate transport protein